jgi:wyosine [tRNA(Phe)-imidazoG37] synthetase (radical SAM superfamily)
LTIPLKTGILYGPVDSRRLGRSLGINLLPAGRKVCTFDCAYCQYGWTDRSADASDGFLKPGEVERALEALLPTLPRPPAYLTFSGNGEPTLHPAFPEIVERVIAVRDRLAPSARTAILSNSGTAGREDIRRALRRLDIRIMKLDAGTEAGFSGFNRPLGGLTLEGIADGLAELGEVTVQSLWAGGASGNRSEGEVEAWITRLRRIRPWEVQVYSLARGWPEPGLEPLERRALESIGKNVRAAGIPAAIY